LIAALIWFGSAWLFLLIVADTDDPITRKTVRGALVCGPFALLIVAWVFVKDVMPFLVSDWRRQLIAWWRA
jgi:hypothetical protein